MLTSKAARDVSIETLGSSEVPDPGKPIRTMILWGMNDV